jgi:hypothetical protein
MGRYAFERTISAAYFDSACRVAITVIHRPRIGASAFARVPDIDNVVKAMLDAMAGCFYRDDQQVHEVTCKRMFSDDERTLVDVEYLSNEAAALAFCDVNNGGTFLTRPPRWHRKGLKCRTD